jgi:hypothetical protein
VESLAKVGFLWKVWPKSVFSGMFKVGFSGKFGQSQFFWKVRPKSVFSGKFDQSRFFCGKFSQSRFLKESSAKVAFCRKFGQSRFLPSGKFGLSRFLWKVRPTTGSSSRCSKT